MWCSHVHTLNLPKTDLPIYSSAVCVDFGWYAVPSIKCHSNVITYFLTHGAEPFLWSRQLCSHSRTSQHFMKSECSIPCSQEPPNWFLPRAISIQSTPSHPISLRSIFILSTRLRLGLSSGLFPSGFPTNILYAFLFSPCYMPRPSLPFWLLRCKYDTFINVNNKLNVHL
jgi:hypothetical protein